MSCHVITLSSLHDSWLHEWTSVAQFLRSRTALISLVLVSTVHIKMLSIQDILGLPRHRLSQQGLSSNIVRRLSHDVFKVTQRNFLHECVSTVHSWHPPGRKPALIGHHFRPRNSHRLSDALAFKCLKCIFPPASSTPMLRSNGRRELRRAPGRHFSKMFTLHLLRKNFSNELFFKKVDSSTKFSDDLFNHKIKIFLLF